MPRTLSHCEPLQRPQVLFLSILTPSSGWLPAGDHWVAYPVPAYMYFTLYRIDRAQWLERF